MLPPIKIKASALQFAILIAALIALLLLSFLTLTNTHRFFSIKSDALLESTRTLERSFFLSEENNTSEIISSHSYWGGFEKLKSSISHGNDSIERIALVGAIKSKENIALYLEDHNNSLVLVGDTKIQGKAIIPSKGVVAGSISGEYYTNDQLIYGSIAYSQNTLPQLETGYSEYVRLILNSAIGENQEVTGLSDNLTNSFVENEKVIYSRDALSIFEKITGYVRVQSDKEILVELTASLHDAMLVAPIVRIKSGFKGNIHVMASDSIIVEQNVQLVYPSSLVIHTNSNIENPAIVIEDNSSISGVITFLQDNIPVRPTLNINISEKAEITGDIYCQGYLELSGVIRGSVYTHKFLTRASGNQYINHILGGKILPKTLNENYVGLPLSGAKKGVVQWLY